MKILYLITKSNWGGAQKYVYELANTFKGKGHDVLVAFGGFGELGEKLEESGIRTISLDSLVRDIDIGKEVSSMVTIYRLLTKEKPDVLHVNSSKAGGLGAFLGRLTGVKHIVYTVHGAPFREDRSVISKGILYFLTFLTCLFSHKIITVSRRDEQDIAGMFFMKKKVTTIYNGIIFNGNLVRSKPKTRETHIVTIGDLTKNKGYFYGLHAIDILVKKGFPIKYTIEGEGEDRKKIEEFLSVKELKDTVTLLGRTLKTKDELQEFDIFLLPSVKEGLPYVLLEAGRAMLPVVTTITGGVPEIVRHEETGLLAQPKNPEHLAEALERYIVDRKFAKKMGQQLHSHVVQNFSYSKMIVETAKVYGLIEGKAMKQRRP